MILPIPSKPKFDLGTVYVSQGVLNGIKLGDVTLALSQYAHCKWGEVGRHMARGNNIAVREGHNKRGVYSDRRGGCFIIHTSGRGGGTLILLPVEC